MYVITGATGNTGSVVANELLKAGKQVTVIGRDAKKLETFIKQGAKAAIGDLEDTDFLAKTFAGASAIYAVIPPKWDLTEAWRTYQNRVGTSIASAIQKTGVKNVVVLSSNGAQLPSGAGPVSGLYEFEQHLQKISALNILSLRAGYFMQNLFGVIGMIKHLGFFGYSLNKDLKMPIVHTNDIGSVAAKHLLALDFKGFQHVFVSGAADLSMGEVANILGDAINNPNLNYVTFSKEDAKGGMLQAGIPETIADGYNELFDCLNKGEYLNGYQRTAASTTETTLEWFAKNEFAPAYQQA
jgi:uncharacterized protein YbjT (DUF2867 family)